MTNTPARIEPSHHVGIEVLRHLGLDPNKPEVRALVLLCERYGLDPLLGQAEIISSRGKFEPYITRDGMLDIAHRSGQLDGIVVDEQRRNSTGDGWTCFVSVYRKDMGHAFRYGAQCKDTEPQAKSGRGPEQALARAERRALKRAFNVQAIDADDDGHVEPPLKVRNESGEERPRQERPVSVETAQPPGEVRIPAVPNRQGAAHQAVGQLTDNERQHFLERWGIAEFESKWPENAVDEALGMPF